MHSAPPISPVFTGARGSLFQFLSQQQIRPRRVRFEYPYAGKWTSDGTNSTSSGIIMMENSGVPAPPLTLSFTKERGNGHYLVVADEDGFVEIYNTGLPVPGTTQGGNRSARWMAHINAVFDACWIKEDAFMLTASGDQTVSAVEMLIANEIHIHHAQIKVWDVDHKTAVGVMKGHIGSVKSLSANPSQSDLFVSGARDGCVAFWDIRAPAATKQSSYGPVAKVKDAHKGFTVKSRRSQGYTRSVTAVLYLKDERVVATAGANDGVVKFWDTRKLKAPVAHTPLEGLEATCPGKNGNRLHGIAGLSQDPTGTRLIATCVDSKIYMYDVMRPERGALRTFSGHLMGTFYIKAAFSPDGSHILSGSSDHKAYLWKVDEPERNPTVLEGHCQEVTAVSWCPTDFCKIATCSDDYTVRIWTMNEPQFARRVSKESRISYVRPFATDTEAPASPCAAPFPSSEWQGQAVARLDTSSSVDDPAQTTDVAVLGFGTSHNSRNKEVTPASKRLRVLQDYPDGKENNRPTEDQQLASPQLKVGWSPSSVLSPPGSVSRRRKTIVDYFGVQPKSPEANAVNRDKNRELL